MMVNMSQFNLLAYRLDSFKPLQLPWSLEPSVLHRWRKRICQADLPNNLYIHIGSHGKTLCGFEPDPPCAWGMWLTPVQRAWLLLEKQKQHIPSSVSLPWPTLEQMERFSYNSCHVRWWCRLCKRFPLSSLPPSLVCEAAVEIRKRRGAHLGKFKNRSSWGKGKKQQLLNTQSLDS